nr:altronate dehydratase family protein [Salinimicrobium tongyeongense]
MDKAVIISPNDNVAVALQNIQKGELLKMNNSSIKMVEDVPVKHKISLHFFCKGDIIYMYGVPVGEVIVPIPPGGRLTTVNVKHLAAEYKIGNPEYDVIPPDVGHLENKYFHGYYRGDGQVGTRNFWLFIPMVFCQNRNLQVLKEAFDTELGYKKENPIKQQIKELIGDSNGSSSIPKYRKIFENIDGIKFLSHEGGCGGTREDAQMLVNLLAGYINNPNVAGATVLSLGCQHAQVSMLQEVLKDKYICKKPVLYFEQQQYASEKEMLRDIVNDTFKKLKEANKIKRNPAPLSKLSIGLECGGSDGFSGITANPLIGNVSDKIGALGGKGILSEFPELCGVEQDIINRCETRETAEKFINLMEAYNTRAKEVGSGFDMNPSPGNIKDGLITDAIKSAGAATKGGRAAVTDVLDYTEYAVKPGLNLLCTPGNDVESTTGLCGSGANLILFSTGLGTPTGNPICPVLKISSNSALPKKITDIIDFDAGRIISEGASLEDLSEELLELIVEVASGTKKTCADILGQDDFIPWKRGVSL